MIPSHTQHIVFTRGDFKPDWKNTRVAHDVKEEINALKSQPGKNIIVWGGANFAASLIKLKLIDKLRLVLNPIALRRGKPLFDNDGERNNLQIIDPKVLTTGAVVLHYKLNN